MEETLSSQAIAIIKKKDEIISALQKERDALRSSSCALRNENAALRTENAALKSTAVPPSAGNEIVSFVRILKFQSQGLGYTVFLSLPVLGLVALASSLELTDWTSSAAPTSASEVYLATTFSLIFGGLICFGTCVASVEVGAMFPHSGSKMALRVTLPWLMSTCLVCLVFVLGLSWAGVEVNFYHIDVLIIPVCVIVGTVGGFVLIDRAGPSVNPEKYALMLGSTATATEPKDAKRPSGTLAMFISVIIVVVACKCTTALNHFFLRARSDGT